MAYLQCCTFTDFLRNGQKRSELVPDVALHGIILLAGKLSDIIIVNECDGVSGGWQETVIQMCHDL